MEKSTHSEYAAGAVRAACDTIITKGKVEVRCSYCRGHVWAVQDWHCISKGLPAHTACAWAVDAEFWAAWDDKNAHASE